MDFPRWFYHKDFPDGKIFKCQEDVPKGCVSNPADIHAIETEPPKPNGTERDMALLGGNIFEEDITLKKRGRPPKEK